MTERLDILELGAQGDGIASHQGQQVFVPFTLAGETVSVRLGEKGRARLVEVLEPSSRRAEPVCDHFGRCGGCALQHLTPEDYAAFKRGVLVTLLERAGIKADLLPTWQAPLGSRRRASFGMAREGSAFRLAFQEKGTINPVPLRMCPVLDDRIVKAFGDLSALARFLHQHHKTRLVVLLADNGLDVAVQQVKPIPAKQEQALIAHAAGIRGLARLSLNGETILSLQPASHTMGPASVVPPPAGFLQAVKAAEDIMTAFACRHLEGAGKVADFFSGCGAFSFPLARFAEVDAYESERAALGALEAAQGTRGLRTVRPFMRDLFREPVSGKRLSAYEGAVLDPPRAGAKAQVEAIAANPLARVVMISCNPASFVRDARILLDAGYEIGEVLPIDQFLYAPHLELAASFTYRG